LARRPLPVKARVVRGQKPKAAEVTPPAPAQSSSPWFRLSGRQVALIAAGLSLLQFGLAANSLVQENPTVDEVVHLPAGLTYWQKGTFKVYHHNPPLVKMLAALPVLFAGADTGSFYRSESWRLEYPAPAMFGRFFLLSNSDRYFELFTQARLVMPLFSILGGVVVFCWSRRLYGNLGGVLSLTLWTVCPNILAHGRLITSDLGGTAIGAGATYLFWRYLREPKWSLAVLAGVALGIAELTKFSLLIFYGLWPLLWLLFELARWERAGFATRFIRSLGQGATIVVLSILVIDAGYFFEGVGIPLGRFDFASRTLTRVGKTVRPRTRNDLLDASWDRRVNRFRNTVLGSLPVPLPKHFLLGFDEQKLEADGVPEHWINKDQTDPNINTGYPVYLDGIVRRQGWRDYYVRCLIYKMPEGTWLLLTLATIVLFASRRSRASWADESVLIVMPAAVLLSMTFLTDINLGLRYVLAMFPYLFIGIGKLGRWIEGLAGPTRSVTVAVIAISVAANITATALIHPHYLAYFNWVSGGPDRRPAHLIDSNLDWGQDLTGLREWVRRNPTAQPIGLAYFGQIPPAIFAARNDGFEWFLPPVRRGTLQRLDFQTPAQGPAPELRPGVYAISATFVYGLPFRVDDPERRSLPGTWRTHMHAFSYFQRLRPFDTIGHSILLYRVTEDDARQLNAFLAPS
jgi:4-amino-4-deoxy-L-arabinose transferase-like glycosyltransferase